MRELSEHEMSLVAGGGQSSEERFSPDPVMDNIGVEGVEDTGGRSDANGSGTIKPIGSNAGYTGPTWTNSKDTVSVTLGGNIQGGEPVVGVGVTIKTQ